MPHPANRLNVVRLVRGQTKTIAIEVKQDSGRAAKLSGANIVMSVGDLIRKEVGNGIEITDQAKGKAVITLTSADTELLVDSKYPYDIWTIYPGDPPVRQPVVKSADLVVSESVTSFS